MDFASLAIAHGPLCEFSLENKQLRKDLYILFANTRSLQELFADVRNRFQKYIDANLLRLRLKYDEDILNSFLVASKCDESRKEQFREELKVKINARPLFASIKIAPTLKISNQVVQAMNRIGYQHLHIALFPKESSSSTSDSDFESGDNVPVAKKLKTCQKAMRIDCDSILQEHMANNELITGTGIHVDILIYLKETYCKELSNYLGLIYIEGLLEEVEDEDILFRLNNKNAKLYRLIQSCINKKLIAGCNNICLVNNLVLWKNINANVRAYIVDNQDKKNIEVAEISNFQVSLGKEASSFLAYIEAVTVIIDEALNCKCHVIAKYECGQNLYSKVKLSLISIVPLYVLRYLSQCKIVDCKHEL